MNDPFQDVDKAGLEFAENTAKTMEIRQSEPIMEKIVHDYLTELEFVAGKPTIEIGCGPGAISRRIAKHASGTQVKALIRRPIISISRAKAQVTLKILNTRYLTETEFH